MTVTHRHDRRYQTSHGGPMKGQRGQREREGGEREREREREREEER